MSAKSKKLGCYLNKLNCYGQPAYEKQTKKVKTICNRTAFIRRNKNKTFEVERDSLRLEPAIEGRRVRLNDRVTLSLPSIGKRIVLSVDYDEYELFEKAIEQAKNEIAHANLNRKLCTEVHACELQVYSGTDQIEKFSLRPSDRYMQDFQKMVENFIAYDFACKYAKYFYLQKLPFAEVVNLTDGQRQNIDEKVRDTICSFRYNLEQTFLHKPDCDSQAEIDLVFGKDIYNLENAFKENIDAALKEKERKCRTDRDGQRLKRGKLFRLVKDGVKFLYTDDVYTANKKYEKTSSKNNDNDKDDDNFENF